MICTHTSAGSTFSHAYVIGGYSASLASFKALAEVALTDFPSLTDDQIVCSVVTRSDRCKNCIVVHFSVPAGTMNPNYRDGGCSPDFDLVS